MLRKQDVTRRVRKILAEDGDWHDYFKSFQKRLEGLMAVEKGEARVLRYWREPYREKKVREIKGHWVHVIRKNKP